jgi:acyl-CoA synthetase (AMP-forming)/AMP-acid ligase II
MSRGTSMRLSDCVTRAADTWPDRIATSYLGRSRTWKQVSEDIGRLATGLCSLGVMTGDRIALLGENSDHYLAAYFAASWLGAAVVPLNARLTLPELAACVSDSGARILLADDSSSGLAARLAGDVHGLSHVGHIGDSAAPAGFLALGDMMAAQPCDPADGDGDMVAGIFYTGGTTGMPKGVVLTHDNLLANAAHVLPALGWSDRTVFLHAAPMFHLADICCLVAISAAGGRHVIMPRFDPDGVISAVQAHQVTALGLVPTMISAVTSSLAGRALPSLTSILYGGAPMPEELITRTRRALPQVRLYQAYGQTEASPILTLLGPEQHASGPEGKAGSAGLAVPGCEVAILDPETCAELPRGQAGEICGRGDNVMRGYWGRPDLTKRALRGGWLHTGDAGYLDEDGFLFVVGRLDDMIITGGENVYPTEVEQVLYQHPAVAEAAVIGVPDEHWGQRVHAVVVFQAGEQPELDVMVKFFRQRLGGYKCPRSFEVRAELPKTGAGKIDKRQLLAPATPA